MKSNKGLFILLVISIIIIFILCGYIYYDKKTNNDVNNNEVNINAEVELTNDKEKNLLIQRANLLKTGVVETYTEGNVSQKAKNWIVLSQLTFSELSAEEKEIQENCSENDVTCLGLNPCSEKKLSLNDFLNNYNDYFTGTVSDYETTLPYNYDNVFKNYYYGYCGDPDLGYIEAIFNYKYTKDNNYYYVYQSVALIDNGINGDDIANNYKTDIDKGFKVYKEEDNFKITADNYNQYKQFKLTYQKIDNNFVFVDMKAL